GRWGGGDAGLVICLAAAVSGKVDRVACEEMLLSYRPLVSSEGRPINAASILPGVLQTFDDLPDVRARIAPRDVLIASGIGDLPRSGQHLRIIPRRFSDEPSSLM